MAPILIALLTITREILPAVADGRVSADEADRILVVAGRELAAAAEPIVVSLTDELVSWVRDLVEPRTAEELLERAAELDAKGRDKRAARLRARAERRA